MTSPTGWISANIYANFLPLVILLITIGYGAAAIAGQEHDGHLELVMSMPFSRRRVVLEKVGVLVVQATVLMVAVFLSVLAGRWFDLSIGIGHLATASIGVLLLGVDLGLLAARRRSGHRQPRTGPRRRVDRGRRLVPDQLPRPAGQLARTGPLPVAVLLVGRRRPTRRRPLTGAFAILLGVAVVIAIVAIKAFERHDLA